MVTKTIKRKVFKQLVEGDFNIQLQLLLSKLFGDHVPPGLADELMAKILASFSKSISVLDPLKPVSVSVDGSINTSSEESPADAVSGRRSVNFGDFRKRPLGVNRGKRGCYKRKRKSQSWTLESNTFEDTHTWRKYGQKEILNAKYPRSYFRCTQKYTEGCRAIKQVQKLEHDPCMFQITYIGNHTCNPNEGNLTIIGPSEIVTDSCNVISHCNNSDIDKGQAKAKQEDNPSVMTLSNTVKGEETNEYDPNCDTTGDLLIWQDIMAFEYDQELMYEYCCGETSNSHGVDMDLMLVGDSLSFSDACCL